MNFIEGTLLGLVVGAAFAGSYAYVKYSHIKAALDKITSRAVSESIVLRRDVLKILSDFELR